MKRDASFIQMKKRKDDRPLITLTTASLDFTHVMTEERLCDRDPEESNSILVSTSSKGNHVRISDTTNEAITESESISTTTTTTVVWTKHMKFRRRPRQYLMEKDCSSSGVSSSPKCNDGFKQRF